jgi:hypothetical protein
VLSQGEAFDLLVTACPSFLTSHDLDEFIATFEEEDTPDTFVRAMAFDHHLATLIASRDVEELPGVFVALDRLLTDGDAEAVELATLGVIEALANVCSHPDVGASGAEVVELLGDAALAVWADNDELWREARRWRPEGAPSMSDADYAGIDNMQLRRYVQGNYRRMPDGVRVSVPDVLRYQTELAELSPITPAGRPRFSWTWVAVAAVLLVLAVYAVR